MGEQRSLVLDDLILSLWALILAPSKASKNQ